MLHPLVQMADTDGLYYLISDLEWITGNEPSESDPGLLAPRSGALHRCKTTGAVIGCNNIPSHIHTLAIAMALTGITSCQYIDDKIIFVKDGKSYTVDLITNRTDEANYDPDSLSAVP